MILVRDTKGKKNKGGPITGTFYADFALILFLLSHIQCRFNKKKVPVTGLCPSLKGMKKIEMLSFFLFSEWSAKIKCTDLVHICMIHIFLNLKKNVSFSNGTTDH